MYELCVSWQPYIYKYTDGAKEVLLQLCGLIIMC